MKAHFWILRIALMLAALAIVIVEAQPVEQAAPTTMWWTAADVPIDTWPGLRVRVVQTPSVCIYIIQSSSPKTKIISRTQLPAGKGC